MSVKSEASVKSALITGAASGMGRVFTLRMAAQGFRVAALDRDEVALAALQAESASIDVYPADVRDFEQLTAIADQHIQQYGAIDRLVTCAAIMPTAKLADQAANEINNIMAVNYGGTVNTLQAVLPAMLERNVGEVIVFGSSGGYLPVTECGAYVATKFATNIYLEILMEENRESAVQFMLVCPPLVDTPLLNQATATSNPKMISESIALKRFSSADEIIDAVELGLLKNTRIVIPGLATKLMIWIRRFSPRLLWRLVRLNQ